MDVLKATVTDLLSWGPCWRWKESKIRAIAEDKEEWTALEVLSLENVEAVDRLWIVVRPELISEPTLHELACRFAEHVLPLFESRYPFDPRPRNAINVKRQWIADLISDKKLAKARATAKEAFWEATANEAFWEATAKEAVAAATLAAETAMEATQKTASEAAWATVQVAQVAQAAQGAAKTVAWEEGVATEAQWQINCVRELITPRR